MTDGNPPLATPHVRRVRPIAVALVNNTSDRALAATEAQFLRLLRSAALGIDLEVIYFTCPEIVRSVPARTATGGAYAEVYELPNSRCDAMIVTGMEPIAPDLREEPVWPSLAELIDWADHRGVPSIWSCLAAHAAVLHLDGIGRTRHPAKLSDIYACDVSHQHPLTHDVAPRWSVPHSRYYGIPEAALTQNGYHVLSRSATAGVDIFTKEDHAQFLFFQGHPEYDQDSLLREYRRDLRRYFSGERDEYPIAPASYFDPGTALVLAEVRQQVLATRRAPEALDKVLEIARTGTSPVTWSVLASRIYANWLAAFVLGESRTSANAFVPEKPTTTPRWPGLVAQEVRLGK